MKFFRQHLKSIYCICILMFIVLFGTNLPIAIAKTVDYKDIKTSRIIDGDTFVADQMTIRIWGIDAPEKRQRFGPQATEFLASLIWDKPLLIKVRSKDQYGRSIAQVFHEGVDIGVVMVRYGYAWHYVSITKDKTLAKAQADAKKQNLGLWQDKNSIAPWVFRKVPKAQ